MTAVELAKHPAPELSTNAWLREIAIQLALMNERLSRGPGRPKK